MTSIRDDTREKLPAATSTRDANRDKEYDAQLEQWNAQNDRPIAWSETTQHTPTLDVSAISQLKSNTEKTTQLNATQIPLEDTATPDTLQIAQDQAQSQIDEWNANTESLKVSIPERGVDDIMPPQIDLHFTPKLKTGTLQSLKTVQNFKDEYQSLLDKTPKARQIDGEISKIQTQIQMTHRDYEKNSNHVLSKHLDDIAKEKENSKIQEKQAIAQHQSETQAELECKKNDFKIHCDTMQLNFEAETIAEREIFENEKSIAQSQIEDAEQNAQKETAEVEKSGDKERDDLQSDRSVFEEAKDWAKDKLESIAAKITEKLTQILETCKKSILTILDKIAITAQKYSQKLGKKLKQWCEFAKKQTIAFFDAARAFVKQKIDDLIKGLKALLLKLEETLKILAQRCLDDLQNLLNVLEAGIQCSIDAIHACLDEIKDAYNLIIEEVCLQIGTSADFVHDLLESGSLILDDPWKFITTCANGVCQGFQQFGANILDNIKVIGANLFTRWLEPAGLTIPSAFSIPSLIQMLLEVLGFDLKKVIDLLGLDGVWEAFCEASAFGKTPKPKEKTKNVHPKDRVCKMPDNPQNLDASFETTPNIAQNENKKEDDEEKRKIAMLVETIQQDGVSAIVPMIAEHGGAIFQEMIKAAIGSIAKELVVKTAAKIALMANPAGAIVSIIMSVYNISSFLIDQFKAIMGLLSSIGKWIAAAARGETDGVANMLEATLCQAIPLVLDLLLRLLGINIGAKMKELVSNIQEKVKSIVDIIAKPIKMFVSRHLADSANALKERREKKWSDDATAPKKDTQKESIKDQFLDLAENELNDAHQDLRNQWMGFDDEKIEDMRTEREKERVTAVTNDRVKKANDKSLASRGLYRANIKLANLSDRVEDKKEKNKNKGFHITELKSVFDGEKEGQLGLHLHKVQFFEELDEYNADQKRKFDIEEEKKAILQESQSLERELKTLEDELTQYEQNQEKNKEEDKKSKTNTQKSQNFDDFDDLEDYDEVYAEMSTYHQSRLWRRAKLGYTYMKLVREEVEIDKKEKKSPTDHNHRFKTSAARAKAKKEKEKFIQNGIDNIDKGLRESGDVGSHQSKKDIATNFYDYLQNTVPPPGSEEK